LTAHGYRSAERNWQRVQVLSKLPAVSGRVKNEHRAALTVERLPRAAPVTWWLSGWATNNRSTILVIN